MNSSHNLWLSWWSDADWVLRAVFIILIGLSVLSWTVIIYKWRQISAAQRIERERSRHIAPTADINELAKRLSGDELSQALQQELKDLVAAHPQSDLRLHRLAINALARARGHARGD